MNLLDAPFVVRSRATPSLFLYIAIFDGMHFRWTPDVSEAKRYPTFETALAEGFNVDNVVTLKQAIEDATTMPCACACGCGAMMSPTDRKGRERRFINGHNAKMTSSLASTVDAPIILQPKRIHDEKGAVVGIGAPTMIGTTLAETIRLQAFGVPDAPPTHMCKACAALWWRSADGKNEDRAYDHRPRGACADGGCHDDDLLELPEYLRTRKPATVPIQHWTPSTQKAAIIALVDGIVKNSVDAEMCTDVEADEVSQRVLDLREAVKSGRETLDQVLTAVLS